MTRDKLRVRLSVEMSLDQEGYAYVQEKRREDETPEECALRLAMTDRYARGIELEPLGVFRTSIGGELVR